MKYHNKCKKLQAILYRTRQRLEKFGARIGNDDDLFKFQATFMDITVLLRQLENEVAEDTWSKTVAKQNRDGGWYSIDEGGKRVEVDGVHLNP